MSTTQPRNYTRPVIETDEPRINSIVQSLQQSAELIEFSTVLPELGTNLKHITVHLYTIGKKDERKLIVDMHITQFTEFIPEDAQSDEILPMETELHECGEYYLSLASEISDTYSKNAPFGYVCVEYDSESNYAIFSQEIELLSRNPTASSHPQQTT